MTHLLSAYAIIRDYGRYPGGGGGGASTCRAMGGAASDNYVPLAFNSI